MAVMSLNSSMVYWKITITEFDLDITYELREFLRSIKIKKTILPLKRTKGKQTPSEAEISITSKDYIEDLFVEGLSLKIYIGYDKLTQPLVFSGKLVSLPNGSARDMLNYKVKAYSNEINLAMEQKNRVFNSNIKEAIISEIVAPNGLIPYISIEDIVPIKQHFMPTQIAKTDLEMLQDLAKKWNCVCWFAPPNFFYFVDSENAHLYGDRLSNDLRTYNLGYRTDKVPCNVETIEWRHSPPTAGSSTNPGVTGFNELGATSGKNEYRIQALGSTWRLKPEYLVQVKKNPKIFGKYSLAVSSDIIQFNSYNSLRKYFRLVDYNENSSSDVPPSHDDSGWDITVTLNEGDPYLEPPRNANLYAGSINPRADSSQLPKWLFRYADQSVSPAKLKINTVELNYENGKLDTKLKCSIGMFI